MADKDKEKEKEKPAKQPKAAPTGAQAKAIEKGKAEAASKKGPKVEGGEQVAPKSLRLRQGKLASSSCRSPEVEWQVDCY